MAQNQFEFVTFTNPQDERAASNRQLVRSQALRYYHRHRVERHRRANEIELDVSHLQRSGTGVSRPLPPHDDDFVVDTPDPLSFGHSQLMDIDPFFQYPMNMGVRECALYYHLHDETCTMFRTMRDIGFLHRVRQTAGFLQLLAMSSWHIGHQGHPADAEHLAYSLAATRKLQAEINDPSQCLTDNALAAVLLFACAANLIHDANMLNIHMRGLQQMILQRGGLKTLDADPVVRLILFWADINGSFLQDRPPFFQAPHILLPRMDYVIDTSSSAATVSSVCSAINHLQGKIRVELASRRVWSDPIYPGLHISPLLGQLLTLKSVAEANAAEKRTIEMVRLAAIIYISNLRARFGVDTLVQTPLFAQKLLATLQDNGNEAPSVGWHSFRLWSLTVAATTRCASNVHRAVFISLCSQSLVESSMTLFETFVACLKQFVWDEELLDVEWRRAREIFQQLIATDRS